jgi:hypothetical protein
LDDEVSGNGDLDDGQMDERFSGAVFDDAVDGAELSDRSPDNAFEHPLATQTENCGPDC